MSRVPRPFTARTPRLSRWLPGESSSAMSIEFAPEPEPTGNVLDLEEGQTTGPLPLGFEFEFFGVRYTWFDLSSDGFMTFGTLSLPRCPGSQPGSCFIPLSADLNNFIALGWTDDGPRSGRRVAYEVRGAAPRRRLVLSLSGALAPMAEGLGTRAAQLVLHERTGMIDVYTTRQSLAAYRVNLGGTRFTTAPPGTYLRHA
jgi:hypothetical protein